jgi:hypothetical protein
MRIMRRPRSVFAVLSACLVLAGCGSGPSQVSAAVIIGDREITMDRVQALLDDAVRDQPAAVQLAEQHKLDLLGREIVRQLVTHELVTTAARREGLRVDSAQLVQVENALAQPVSAATTDPSQLAEGIVARARDHAEYATDYLLESALAAKYVGTMSVTFDYTTVTGYDVDAGTEREQALAKADRFAASPDAATGVVSADASAGLEASLRTQLPALGSPSLAATVLFGVPAGTVVAFQPDPGQSLWVVAAVRRRDLTTAVPVSQPVQPTAGQLVSIGTRLLQPYLAGAAVRINPRYGVWDPVAMGLAPSAAETSGFVLPVKGFVQP